MRDQFIAKVSSMFAVALATSISMSFAAAPTSNTPTLDNCEQTKFPCKINCVDPHACCAESQKVLDVLQNLVTAMSKGDLKAYEEYLDDHCTTMNESTHKLVSGKENVLNDLKAKFEKYAPEGPTPLLSFTIDQPYAKVCGDTAVVTFVAYREIGGKHPCKEKCNVTDVFVKRNDTWKKLHFRGQWKKFSA